MKVARNRETYCQPKSIGFVDEERLDLRLREDSPVYRMIPGFVPIPYEKIGLYRDEFRR